MQLKTLNFILVKLSIFDPSTYFGDLHARSTLNVRFDKYYRKKLDNEENLKNLSCLQLEDLIDRKASITANAEVTKLMEKMGCSVENETESETETGPTKGAVIEKMVIRSPELYTTDKTLLSAFVLAHCLSQKPTPHMRSIKLD